MSETFNEYVRNQREMEMEAAEEVGRIIVTRCPDNAKDAGLEDFEEASKEGNR